MRQIDAEHWQQRLDTVAREAGVVGAVLGILRLNDDGSDEMMRAATGVLNWSTGRNTTVDSLFQVGSITKTYVATVIMQLVDEGKIALDQAIKDIVPGFRMISDDLTDNMTIRHCLNHTSGLDGDVFIDTGRGDDALDKYMTVLGNAVQTFPVGAMWSYCNTGFSILGRVIEVVTGQVWDAAMRERLFAPLGLTHTITLPEDALLFDTAVGHLAGLPEPIVTHQWGLARSNGPAGAITASIGDLLSYSRLHLMDDLTPSGEQLVSAESMQAMHAYSVDVPEKGSSWGLGIERFDWGGAQLIGHDGATIGQNAYLRLYPEGNLAVGLLTNGGCANPLYYTLFREIFAELCDVIIPPELELPEQAADVDITPWVGTYERDEARIEIVDEPEGPLFRRIEKGELAEVEENPVLEFRLTPIRDGLFGAYVDERKKNMPVWFMKLPNGDRYVHFSSRATRKAI